VLNTCRERLNTLFNGENPHHFIFTLNCTDALNLAIHGLVRAGETHRICSHIDHNSILRPLNALQDARAIEQTRVPIDPQTGLVDPAEIRRAVRRASSPSRTPATSRAQCSQSALSERSRASTAFR
jgi:selenocysteine lyase/cysteine desulfurase